MKPSRRDCLAAGSAGMLGVLLQPWAAHAAPSPALQAAIDRFAGGAPLQTGRVTLAIDAVVENGNTVPVSVSVQSPMTAEDHVRRIGLFTELNPQPEVALFTLGPASGRAQVATRMRMASSQHVIALAQMSDGSVWQHRVAVVVALAACLEGE
ncbi:sulfur oxidation protein SoxY [beta proteobacterium AAP51]|nr:sulfur oxidation protein SoxY [beta proteobacterium AAP51]